MKAVITSFKGATDDVFTGFFGQAPPKMEIERKKIAVERRQKETLKQQNIQRKQLAAPSLPISMQASSRGISVISDLSHTSGKLGAYRALIIGINDYKDPKIPDLETAVDDANAMAELLHKRYGFQVKLLLGSKATRRGIFQSLRKLASSTKPDESILIYYAGHGDLDRTYNDGWWVPFDAKGGDPVTYLDNVQVQKAMRSMKARHVLLISDSCYSGTLFGQTRAMPQVIDNKYYLDLYNERSRWGMTSGNKTPVSDIGSGDHSVFAYQLLKELRKNEKPYMSTQELYTRIAPIISNNSEQTPVCRPILHTGDQGGEFLFVASNISTERKQLEAEKLKQEKPKSKQLAYISKTPAQVQPESRLRLAVFPFCESALEDSKVNDQKEFTDFVIKFTKKVPNIILTHSFYPYNEYETDDRPESIKKIIPKKIVREIWYGNSRFPRKKPDYDVLKKLGEKINSDLILTFKVVASATHTNQLTITYNGYLIDIEKNIYYERKNYESYDDLTTGFIDFDTIKKMTRGLFKSFHISNPQTDVKY
jgi:hypothetical protein